MISMKGHLDPRLGEENQAVQWLWKKKGTYVSSLSRYPTEPVGSNFYYLTFLPLWAYIVSNVSSPYSEEVQPSSGNFLTPALSLLGSVLDSEKKKDEDAIRETKRLPWNTHGTWWWSFCAFESDQAWSDIRLLLSTSACHRLPRVYIIP